MPAIKRKARQQQILGSLPTWLTTTFTVLVGIATAYQACYTKRYTEYAGRQLTEMKNSAADTKRLSDSYQRLADATDRISGSAKDQADSERTNAESMGVVARASRKTAELASQSLIISHIPFVTVQDVQLLRPLKVDENIAVSYSVSNTGPGQANKLKAVFVLDFPPERTTAAMPFDLRASETSSELTLEAGSHSTNTAKSPVPLLRGDIAAIQSGRLFVRLMGIAMYDDVFGAHYRKEMCNEYDYDPSGKYLGLAYCASHNGPPERITKRSW